MPDQRKRADITSHSRDEASWDAGLHADSERGAIDVGLVVEPTALGLVLDAPDIGVLRLGFDVEPDGTTRLANATRTLADGRPAVVALDQTRVLQLEGALQRAEAHLHAMTHEREHALAQLHELAGLKQAVDEQLAQLHEVLETERASAHSALQTEKDARLVALGERERARAELERLREELDAGSATLMREVSEARAAREASEAEKRRLSDELAELSARLKTLGDEHGQLQAAKQELEQQVLASEGELERATDQAKALELKLSADARAALAAKAEVEETLGQQLDAAKQSGAQALAAERARLTQDLKDAQRAAAQALEAERTQRRSLEQALADAKGSAEQLTQELGAAQRSAAQALEDERAHRLLLEQELAGVKQAGEQALAEALEAKRVADEVHAQSEAARQRELAVLRAEVIAARATDVDQVKSLQAQLNDAHQAAREWESALAAEHEQTAQAREVAKQLNAQVDKLTHERDEARGIARQLHQKTAAKPDTELKDLRTALETERKTAAGLTAERERMVLQLEALTRQLEQERTARARALSERDEFRNRFKAVVGPTSNRIEDSREETRPYSLAPPVTQPEMPSIKLNEVRTDPLRVAVPPVKPEKKKG